MPSVGKEVDKTPNPLEKLWIKPGFCVDKLWLECFEYGSNLWITANKLWITYPYLWTVFQTGPNFRQKTLDERAAAGYN